MQKVVLVFVGVMLAAGVAGAQELPSWCQETPCVRVLAPEEGDTVNPETTFLVEFILTPDLIGEGEDCDVLVVVAAGETPDAHFLLNLQQHQRPRGESPVFYRIYDRYEDPTEVMEVSKPVADVGDYLPHRFRILGELHLEPGDSLLFAYAVYGSGCGGPYTSDDFYFYTSSPP